MTKQMDVEIQILAAIMFDASQCTYAFEHLKPEFFINKQHGQLYKEMKELYDAGQSLDIVSLSEHSKLKDMILDVSEHSFTASNIKTHTNICLDRFYLLVSRKKLIEAIKGLESVDRSPGRLRKSLEDLAFFLADRVQDKGLKHISAVSKQTINELDDIQRGIFPGVQSGFTKLDSMGFYFRNGKMSVLAARPAMGKSALALKIAKNCPKNVAFYSLEMSDVEQYERLISMSTGLTNDDLKNKEILKSKAQTIINASIEINKKKIWINDSVGVTPSMMLNQCKRLQAQHGLGLLIVDYLGLMKADEKFNSRREEVGLFSKGILNIAKKLNIPAIALSQLNRGCEERNDKRPILADLRETGDIEQDAHMVWFLYRPEVYDPQDHPGKAEIIVRKNRSGPTGSTPLTFIKRATDFIDYEPLASEFNANDWSTGGNRD